MKQKAVLILLSCMMAVSLLVGCGSGSKQEEAPAEETVASEETEVVDEAILRETAYGPVTGIRKENALVWYGIPYGKSPVGDLRWEAPQDPEPWTEYDATDWADPAMQLSGGEIIGSEDCLNLDIYSTEGAEKLPVMVFIHGGNNQTGNTKEVMGTELVVKNDVVFVSVNYRLGLLGFNCLPSLMTDEGATGNYAMLDIAKALDWIKANIAEFGGDPENITISGFSAGGRDVMAMLTSPLFAGKFQKAIAFSGGMTLADETMSAKKIAKAIAPLAVEDGKAENEEAAAEWLLGTDEEVKEYLYSVSSERLCALMGNAGIRMSVFPHLYADGVMFPEEGFDTTTYNEVPLIMLTGTTEFSMFAAGDAYFSSEEMAGYSEEEIAQAKEFAIKYGSQMYGYFNTEASAERMADNYKAPIYLCSINYGDTSSQYPFPGLGAFHGIFVPMLSTENNYVGFSNGAFEHPAYVDMANTFNQYLKNFLYTGDPNGEGMPEWTAWEPESHLTMSFDGADDKGLIECKSLKTSYDEIMDIMDQDDSVSEELKQKAIANVINGRWFSDALDQRYNNRNLWE